MISRPKQNHNRGDHHNFMEFFYFRPIFCTKDSFFKESNISFRQTHKTVSIPLQPRTENLFQSMGCNRGFIYLFIHSFSYLNLFTFFYFLTEFDVDRIPDRVQMYQWMNMWGNLTHGAKAMVDFPIWLQILPKILFKVINRRGKITRPYILRS